MERGARNVICSPQVAPASCPSHPVPSQDPGQQEVLYVKAR